MRINAIKLPTSQKPLPCSGYRQSSVPPGPPQTTFRALTKPFSELKSPQIRIHQLLGEGTFGWVHEVTLDPVLVSTPRLAGKFFRASENDRDHCEFEGDLGIKIESPFVGKTFGHGTFDDKPKTFHFILKEFIPGKSFYDWTMEDCEKNWDSFGCTGLFANLKTLQVVRDLALGLRDIHSAGFLLTELSPHNFMLNLDADQKPKFCDLGSATPMDKPSPFIAYDPDFTAPELIHYLYLHQNKKSLRRQKRVWAAVGVSADLYSLGQVIFKVNAEKPHEGLIPLAEALTHKNPRKRPPSIDWVLDRLQSLE